MPPDEATPVEKAAVAPERVTAKVVRFESPRVLDAIRQLSDSGASR